jgi:cell division septum initiation protein DivIVA
MDRADVLYADVVRLIEEVKQLKETLRQREEELKQVRANERELFDCVQAQAEEIELLTNGPIRSGTF